MDQWEEHKSLKIETPFLAKLFFFAAAYPWFAAWQSHDVDLWSKVLLCTVVSVPLLLIGGFINHAFNKPKQKRKDELAQAILQQVENGQAGAYFLYLRPFAVTGKMHYRNVNVFEFTPMPDLEERLANGLSDFGPFVSLGRQLEAFGSSRIPVSEESWKEKVLFLIDTAKVIFMVPGYQDGTKWEMEQIVNNGHLHKTVFLTPTGAFIGGLSAKDHWKRTADAWKDSFGFMLPKYQSEQLFLIDQNSSVSELGWLGEMEKTESTAKILRQIEANGK